MAKEKVNHKTKERIQVELQGILETDRRRLFEQSFISDSMARIQFESDVEAIQSVLVDWISKAKTEEQKEKAHGLIRALFRIATAVSERDNRFYRLSAEFTSEKRLHALTMNKLLNYKKFNLRHKLDEKFEMWLAQQ